MVNLSDDPLHQERNTQRRHQQVEERASQITFHDIAEQELAAYDNSAPDQKTTSRVATGMKFYA